MPFAVQMSGGSSLVAGDFNGDGRADLLSPASLRLALTNGTFGAATAVNAYGDPLVADLDGDGRADVLLGGTTQSALMKGTPAGLGAATTLSAAMVQPEFVNLDGANGLDVVSRPSFTSTTVDVRFNNGSAVFGTPTTFTWARQIVDFAVGEVTGDGNVDLVLLAAGTAANSHEIVVAPGTGPGSFNAAAAVRSTLATRGERLELVDVNRDGRLDVVLSSVLSSNQQGALRWLANQGTGSFSADTVLVSDAWKGAWAFSDLSGDGISDLVVGLGSRELRLKLGLASGGFGGGTPVSSAAIPQVIALGDFDSDGDKDIALLDSWSYAEIFTVTAGAIDTVPTSTFASTGSSNEPGPLVGDFNGDGRDDLARFTGVGIELQFGTAAGGFTTGPVYPLNESVRAWVVDDNGDAPKDLLLSGTELTLLRGSSSGVFSMVWSQAIYARVAQAALFDVDGDGQKDLLATTLPNSVNYGSYSLNWWKRLSTNTFGSEQTLAGTTFSFAFADFDNDGRIDIGSANVVDNYWDRASSVNVLLNQGGGLFVSQPTLSGPASWLLDAKAADMNGDGHVDLVFLHNSRLSYAVGDGRGRFTSVVQIAYPASPQRFDIVDFDGDGALDVLMLSEGLYGVVSVRNLGTSFESRVVPMSADLLYRHAYGNFDGVGGRELLLSSYDARYLMLRTRCP